MNALECPNCGAAVTDPKATACAYCHTAFVAPPKAPAPQVEVVKVRVNSLGPALLAKIFAAIIVMLLVLRFAAERSAVHSTRSAIQASQKQMFENINKDVERLAREKALSASFILRSTDRTQPGVIRLVGDVTSHSLRDIAPPKVTASFFDAKGNEVATASAFAPQRLAPGQMATVAIETTAVQYASVRFEVEARDAAPAH